MKQVRFVKTFSHYVIKSCGEYFRDAPNLWNSVGSFQPELSEATEFGNEEAALLFLDEYGGYPCPVMKWVKVTDAT